MKRLPNMRVELHRTNQNMVLAAGACVSYLATGNVDTIYAEGKPGHIANLLQKAGIQQIGQVHPVPTTKPSSDFIEV